MTGPAKHAENANIARQQLANVKALASEVIGELVCLLKAAAIFSDDLQEMRSNGRRFPDIVADLVGAETAEDMLAALRKSDETEPT